MGLTGTGRKAFRICPIENEMERAQEAQIFTVSLQSPTKITQSDSLRELEKYFGDTNPYSSTELRGTVEQSRGNSSPCWRHEAWCDQPPFHSMGSARQTKSFSWKPRCQLLLEEEFRVVGNSLWNVDTGSHRHPTRSTYCIMSIIDGIPCPGLLQQQRDPEEGKMSTEAFKETSIHKPFS